MIKAWHITQWHQKYEKSDTRKTDYMGWYAKQTKLVGFGIGKTLREPYPQNVKLLGLWALIETLASQSAMNERGWLIRGGAAMDFEDMASLLPTIPPAAFKEAFEWFSHPKINWVEHIDCPHLSRQSPDQPETTGKNSRQSPDQPETTGKNSARERQTERESTDRREREREKLSHTSQSLGGPSVEAVEAWATLSGIPLAFALEKFAVAVEREDFAKPAVQKNWESRFARFWKEDGEKWSKKNPAPPAAAGAGVSLADMRRASE